MKSVINAESELKIRQGARLPHWMKEGAIYAVVFHLGDSLPRTIIESWRFERHDIIRTAEQMGRPLRPHEQERLDKLFSEKVEKYLDEGQGNCWMREDRCAKVVADALAFFDPTRYRLHAWSVMPNHVHAVLEPIRGYNLPRILHSWKSYTAKAMNNILGTRGRLWETEYYDHLIRDERDLQAQIAYVLANPQKAGLREWKWVGAAPHMRVT